MYSPLAYVADGDTAWVDSSKIKQSYESLPGVCKIFIWCVPVLYLLPPFRLKQNVFPRYCNILYLCFHTFFLNKHSYATLVFSACIHSFVPAITSSSPPAPRFLRAMRWTKQSTLPLGTPCRNIKKIPENEQQSKRTEERHLPSTIHDLADFIGLFLALSPISRDPEEIMNLCWTSHCLAEY